VATEAAASAAKTAAIGRANLERTGRASAIVVVCAIDPKYRHFAE
jgi:hypothetical protein